jgi:hypothetical protein
MAGERETNAAVFCGCVDIHVQEAKEEIISEFLLHQTDWIMHDERGQPETHETTDQNDPASQPP